VVAQGEVDPLELLALARHLAEDASALLRDAIGHAFEVDTKSSITDMVSAADRASEQLIVSGIRAARPDDAILGEEGTADAGTTGVRWVIDPLDGTTNFLYGIPAFAVSIAVEHDGDAVAAVVIDVARDEVFTAARGHGAHLGGRRLACRDGSNLATALIATGFGYDPARRAEQGAVVATLLPLVRDIRRVGAAAIDLCWVAAGRVDAYYELGIQPWDRAAGALIASESGALVDVTDDGLTVAAPPGLFEPLRRLVGTGGAVATRSD
jgi:myo-inositol-1(or 4)-monophosphatase